MQAPERLLSVQGFPWGRQWRDPTIRISVQGSMKVAMLPPAPRASEAFPQRIYVWKEVKAHKYGVISNCPGLLGN